MTKALHNLPRNDRLALMRILTRTATKEADNLSCIFSLPGDDELIELAKRAGKTQQVEWLHPAIRPKKLPLIPMFATGEDILAILIPAPTSAVGTLGRSVPMSEDKANEGTTES